MSEACCSEVASERPSALCRIVEFSAREETEVVPTACDEHFAVGQKRSRVKRARVIEAAGDCPGAACRIIEFRARDNADVAVVTTCDEDLAIGQRSRCVIH